VCRRDPCDALASPARFFVIECNVDIGPEHFGNRDLSWLEFNLRVLEEAEDETNPLLERIKFLAIFSGNLDEFLMVRLSGLRSQILGLDEPEDDLPEQLSVHELYQQAHARTRELVDRQYRCLGEKVLPQLEEHGIRLVPPENLTDEQRKFVDDYFRRTVYPVLTPMAQPRVVFGGDHRAGYRSDRHVEAVVGCRAASVGPAEIDPLAGAEARFSAPGPLGRIAVVVAVRRFQCAVLDDDADHPRRRF
jgi:hypothetical protein